MRPLCVAHQVFLRLVAKELLVGVFAGTVQGLLSTVARPLLLKFAIENIMADDAEQSVLWWLVGALGVEQLLEGQCESPPFTSLPSFFVVYASNPLARPLWSNNGHT